MLLPARVPGLVEAAENRPFMTRHSVWFRVPLLSAAIAGLAFAMLFAAPTVTLTDGRVIGGVDLRRDGDLVIIVMPNGTAIPIPSAAVKKLVWVEEGGSAKTGPPSSPANVVKGWSDAEAQDYEERRAVREQETEAWVQQKTAEMEQDKREQERKDEEEWVRHNVGYIQPSGLVGWQPNVAGSTLQPSYWVPEPSQDIGYRP